MMQSTYYVVCFCCHCPGYSALYRAGSHISLTPTKEFVFIIVIPQPLTINTVCKELENRIGIAAGMASGTDRQHLRNCWLKVAVLLPRSAYTTGPEKMPPAPGQSPATLPVSVTGASEMQHGVAQPVKLAAAGQPNPPPLFHFVKRFYRNPKFSPGPIYMCICVCIRR